MNKALYKDLSKKGRFGDTIVAHISRDQSRMLLRGHKPTINPKTGLPEHFLGAVLGSVAGGLASHLLSGKDRKMARAAQQSEIDANKFTAEQGKRLNEVGDKAGAALESSYKGLMLDPEFGTYGRFSRSGVEGAQGDYLDNIAAARGRAAGGFDETMRALSGSDPAALSRGVWGQGTSYDRYGGTGEAMAMADNMALRGFRPSAAYSPYGRDADYSGSTNEFYSLLDDETQRSYQDALADMAMGMGERGMGSSTAAIEARKALASGVARQRAQNLLRASELALQSLQGKQALARGDFDAYTQQDQGDFGRMMDTAKFSQGAGDVAFRNYLAGRQADLSDYITRATEDQRLRFNEADQFFKERGLSRKDYLDSQSMISPDEVDALNYAFGKFDNMNRLRGGTMKEVYDLATQPYAVRAGAYGDAGAMGASAARGFGGVATDAGARAQRNSEAWGKAFGDLFSGKTDALDDKVMGWFGGNKIDSKLFDFNVSVPKSYNDGAVSW